MTRIKQCCSNIKSSYPLKCLQCDRVVVEEISISSQLSCKPQKNVSQHLKLDMDRVRSPSLGACNYPIFLSPCFHRPIYFKFEFISNSDPHRNLSDQL